MTAQLAADAKYRGAWRWGLLFGILQVVLQIGTGLLLGLLGAYSLPGASALLVNLLGIIPLGLSLLLCGYAGYIAARKSGNPSTGNSAGLYAGLVSATVTVIICWLLFYTNSAPFRDLIQYGPIAIAIVVGSGCTIVIYSLLALVAGVIGGNLAQRGMAQAG